MNFHVPVTNSCFGKMNLKTEKFVLKKLSYLIESSSHLAALRLIHQYIRNCLYSYYCSFFFFLVGNKRLCNY